MNIIMRIDAIITYDEGFKEWFLFKRIDNVQVIPREKDWIEDEIYEDFLEVDKVLLNYDENIATIFLKDIKIETKEALNKLSKQLELKKWYLNAD